ncbi:MAG TPA: hypothetical protein VGR21_10785, partial [Cryptosporangiaceae bacterium]|nr:hypothetical protein [Cryptosporangiaceae bacterium]
MTERGSERPRRRVDGDEVGDRPLAATLRRLERASGALATQSVARMDETLPWFRSMPADHRSWITLVAQNGIGALVQWISDPAGHLEVSGDVFGVAPREM